MTRDAFKRYQQGGFTSSTQSSLVPFYSGISGDVNIAKDVLVYTSSTGGLMLEATTGTQKFTYKSGSRKCLRTLALVVVPWE